MCCADEKKNAFKGLQVHEGHVWGESAINRNRNLKKYKKEP